MLFIFIFSAHDLLRHFHVRCGWPKRGQSCDSVDVDDLFENLVEANDILLEEVVRTDCIVS